MKTLTIDKATMMEEIRRLVREGKTVSLTVKGHSMSPFIVHLRDELTVGPWKDEDIRRGTVALVRDVRGNYLIHRILERKQFTDKEGRVHDRVLLQGDGNVGLQEVAELDDVIAILYSIQRKGKSYPVYPKSCRTWRVYSRIWLWLTPLRRYLLALWRRLR